MSFFKMNNFKYLYIEIAKICEIKNDGTIISHFIYFYKHMRNGHKDSINHISQIPNSKSRN